MTTPHQGQLSRREVIAALAAVAGLAALPEFALADVDASVVGMTRPLAGVNPNNPDTAMALYEALADELGMDKLQALASVVRENPGDLLTGAITTAGMDDVANRVIEVFYTGIVTKDGKKVVVHYLDTLQWEAMADFTKAPSRCGAEFGFWNFPPDL